MPYWEDSVDELAEYVPIERILAGSDFPHSDGLADPTSFVYALSGFDRGDTRRIMRNNLKAILVDG